ncbi:MAG: amino acid ABC transporter substrate-binding protein [Pasteurellaceae bacterium]|nr:amino acid ABC transporter substrate-binding protein [Pasteurellaceae bacterium]
MTVKKLTLISALLITTILTACDKQAPNNADNSAQAEKVLHIGSTGQGYPNGFKQDGKLVGFDVETTEAIAKELGYKVEWITIEFAGLMGQLDAERLDTVANAVAVTEARKAKYDFTQPYSYYGSQLVTHNENENIRDYNDLKGKMISGVLGSNHLNILKKVFPNNEVTIKTYETRDGAMYDLVYKRVDAYINSKPILLAEMKRSNLPFKLVGKPLVMEAVAYPFARNARGQQLREQFDQALTKLKQNGTIKALSEKYYGEDITTPEQ